MQNLSIKEIIDNTDSVVSSRLNHGFGRSLPVRPAVFEDTWIAVKHHKKNAGKVGLYKSKEGKVCRGHKIGFEPIGERPIVPGCVRCMKKVSDGTPRV